MTYLNKKNLKKVFTLLILASCIISMNAAIALTADKFVGEWNISKKNCGSYNGYNLKKGTKGACYYINNDKEFIYVSKEKCNCKKSI